MDKYSFFLFIYSLIVTHPLFPVFTARNFKMSKIEREKQRSYSLAEKINFLKCLNEPGITRKDVQQKFDLSEKCEFTGSHSFG